MKTCRVDGSSLGGVSRVESWEEAPGGILHLLGLFPSGLPTPEKQPPAAASSSWEVRSCLSVQRGPSYLPLIDGGSQWESVSQSEKSSKTRHVLPAI